MKLLPNVPVGRSGVVILWQLADRLAVGQAGLNYFFLELTTTDCYVCSLLRSFFSSNPYSLFVWIHQLLIPPTPRADATTPAKALYGDDRNTGTRQMPKVSSAIAEVYHCRILAEVQLAHNRRHKIRAAGECSHADWGTVHPTPPHAPSLYDSTQVHTPP